MAKRTSRNAGAAAKATNTQAILAPSLARSWHAPAFDALASRFEQNNAPHALLITGPAGIGKRALAEALVSRCLGAGTRTPADLAANPDFRAIGPADGSKQIVVDQIRELSNFVTLTAAGGGHRFVLLEPAEAMNTNAQNALLKTLEEPPPGAVILLVSALPGRLLPTVRSRCQRVVLKPPSEEVATAWLKTLGANEADLKLALALANGAPRLAATYLDEEWIGQVKRLKQQLEALMGGSVGPLEVALAWEKQLEALPVFDLAYRLVERRIRQALAGNRSGPDAGTMPPGAAPLDSGRAFAALDRIVAAREMARQGRAVRPRALLEDVLQEMAALSLSSSRGPDRAPARRP